MRTITPEAHDAIRDRLYAAAATAADEARAASYPTKAKRQAAIDFAFAEARPVALPGESQADARRRLMASIRRQRREPGTGDLTFPKFKPGMSTAAYVAAALAPSQRAHLGPLNTAPCTLYEGGALDFEPAHETIEDTTPDNAPAAPSGMRTLTAEGFALI